MDRRQRPVGVPDDRPHRHFDILRRSFGRLPDDPRIQVLVVAFCFGALLEALANFGAPVAICSVMLVAPGFEPVRAAVVALVANTAPVAFGTLGTPVVTLAQVTGLPLDSVASVVGRQIPLLALVVPLVLVGLVGLVDGRRGLRETWFPALACGFAFAVAQFAAANYVSVQLADIGAALAGAGALMAVPHARRPAIEPVRVAVLIGVRSEGLDEEDPRRSAARQGAHRAAARVLGTTTGLSSTARSQRSGLAARITHGFGGVRLRPTAGQAVGAIDCTPHLVWSMPRATGSTDTCRSCAFRWLTRWGGQRSTATSELSRREPHGVNGTEASGRPSCRRYRGGSASPSRARTPPRTRSSAPSR